MKKLFFLLVAMMVLFTLVACGQNAGDTTTAGALENSTADAFSESQASADIPLSAGEPEGGITVFVTDAEGQTVLNENGEPVTHLAVELVTGDIDEGWY